MHANIRACVRVTLHPTLCHSILIKRLTLPKSHPPFPRPGDLGKHGEVPFAVKLLQIELDELCAGDGVALKLGLELRGGYGEKIDVSSHVGVRRKQEDGMLTQ